MDVHGNLISYAIKLLFNCDAHVNLMYNVFCELVQLALVHFF